MEAAHYGPTLADTLRRSSDRIVDTVMIWTTTDSPAMLQDLRERAAEHRRLERIDRERLEAHYAEMRDEWCQEPPGPPM